MLWCWPALVFMTPADPETNPPCHSMVETLGFQSPHVVMSDQTRQTLSGDAVVSTEVPYSRAIDLSPQPDRAGSGTCRRPEPARRSRGTSTMLRVLRKLRVTTPTTSSAAPTSSTGRSGAPCPTGGGSEKIRKSASGYPSSATVASDAGVLESAR